MSRYFDAHLHLDQYDPDQLDRLIDEWQSAGIKGALCVSSDLSSAYQTLELQRKYDGFVCAALGVHPERPLPSETEMEELCSLIKQERRNIFAIGEVGLPYYIYREPNPVEPPPYPLAVERFERFCALANQLRLPILAHAVHDQASVAYRLLRKHQIDRAHFHWLKAPAETIDRIVQAGYFISLTPEVCYRERDRQLAKRVPLTQLLVETDGPWPYDGPFKDHPTTPLLLLETVAAIANVKNVSAERVIESCYQNVQRLLGVDWE